MRFSDLGNSEVVYSLALPAFIIMMAQRTPAVAKAIAEIILGAVDPSSIIFQITIADAKKNIKEMIRAIGRLVILLFISDPLPVFLLKVKCHKPRTPKLSWSQVRRAPDLLANLSLFV